jgi:hypothetical protein
MKYMEVIDNRNLFYILAVVIVQCTTNQVQENFMSFAILVAPAESALPFIRPALTALGVAMMAARPLLGIGLVAVFVWLFKPLISGLGRASLLLFRKSDPIAKQQQREMLRAVIALNRMARDVEADQPNLAAELRQLASRG